MQTSTRIGSRQPASEAARRAPWFQVRPEDGLLTFILVALLVYITVYSIQSVTPPWAPGLQILTTTTVVGLFLGYLSVQQGRIPGLLAHLLALVLGVAFAFAQTADAVLGGNRGALLTHTLGWFRKALLANGDSSDNTTFLLFLGILTFLLAYISVWLVLRTRRPWLAVFANVVVLLINLNWSTADRYFFMALYLLLALLLIVRFTLAENMRQWRARGLRFSPDLGWDFMQTGTVFAVAVLLLAYILPVGTTNAGIASVLGSPQSPIVRLETRLQELFGGLSGKSGAGGAGFFGSSLRLVGKVDLPNIKILHYTLPVAGDDPTQYLITQTFDTYDGIGQWTQSTTQQVRYGSQQPQPTPSSAVGRDTYQITFDQTPDTGQQYLFAPGSAAASFDVPSYALDSTLANMPTTWQAQHPLGTGQRYAASGYISTASEDQLRAVAYPERLPSAQRAKQYPTEALDEYLPLADNSLSTDVRALAQQWTQGATNPYDAALLIEDHLRTFTYSTDNPDPPQNQDATAWFLHTQKGFCTFFASAMALMGRSLGMPTRIASGFTAGTFDGKTGAWVVKGTQAHTWTQIYFGTYGWVNFEPTQTFSKFLRPLESTGPVASSTPDPSIATPLPGKGKNEAAANGEGPVTTTSGGNGLVVGVSLGASLLMILLLLAVAFFLIWWRLIYRSLAPAAAAFARITRLGAWAGAPPVPSQTPNEYAERLGMLVPGQRTTLERVSEMYSRERWGGAPRGDTLETTETLPTLYNQVRGSVVPMIVRRARHLPLGILNTIRRRSRAQGE